ncbi:helix-turn-helix domain-containing protein [Paenibacillus chitinolyticus]|uniref:helix-turn-helix domain-containing protein n=1 Tax=Paenibacillus chitinolyticus TaxID=79263 RepID=UPI001C45B99C|nr:helix-turn-helix transcriptional regulator [Paenibacillus chitinolyticus]MBV6717206.1 helix-turn-helix domain-containing protein [Paenibacillus chitinolyticus]
MEIGLKIQLLREDRGLTSADLAVLAGVAQSTISDLENEKRSPSLNTLEKICDALKVSIVEVLPVEHQKLPKNLVTKDLKQILKRLHLMNEKDREFWMTANDILQKMSHQEQQGFMRAYATEKKEERELLALLFTKLTNAERKNFLSLFQSILEKRPDMTT